MVEAGELQVPLLGQVKEAVEEQQSAGEARGRAECKVAGWLQAALVLTWAVLVLV